MKTGQVNFESLINKLAAEKENARDYTTNTKYLEFHTDDERNCKLTIDTNKYGKKEYGITPLAETQLANRLKIPKKYYDLMKENEPALLDYNVNTWLKEKPETRMVRTLYGDVRAFLSNRYQRIDNLDIAEKVLTVLGEHDDFVAGSMEVTNEHLYIKVISEKFTDEINVGDAVQAGFVISNSEVGLGSVKIEPLIYRLVCTNGMILPDRMYRKKHIGKKQLTNEEDYGEEIFRKETIETENKAYMMKIEDIIRGALNEQIFRATVEKMRKANSTTIDVDPEETVKSLSHTLLLSEPERIRVTDNYIEDENFTQYGLANAVTKTANKTKDYERATELERLGGIVLDTDIKALLKRVDSRKLKKLF